jgi:hypothetical protein
VRRVWIGVAAVFGLGACGDAAVRSVAPTAETVAFLSLDAGIMRECVDVEGAVIDGVAGLITGNAEAAMQAQVERGLQRCGQVAGLIRPGRFAPEQRPRAEACQRAFAGKVEAYTALNQALASEGDFMAAQSAVRRFAGRLGEARPRWSAATHRCDALAEAVAAARALG